VPGDDPNERDEKVKGRRRDHGRAATTHERDARTEREAADTLELFGDAEGAEHHREAARRAEADADHERHSANRKR
jgi:hypothetical protein